MSQSAERGVLGEDGAVEVSAHEAPVHDALEPVFTVVAGAGHDARAEGFLVGIQKRAATMVLESHDGRVNDIPR